MRNTQALPKDGVESTEAKSPERKKLDDLPESSDEEFWADAEIHTNLRPHTEFNEEGHYFELVSGMSAQCRNCHWGFDLDRGDKIVSGHLYDKNGKLII